MECDTWLWDDMPMRPNVRHIGLLLLVSISTISPQSTCPAPVCEILSKSDVMTIFEMAYVRHLGF